MERLSIDALVVNGFFAFGIMLLAGILAWVGTALTHNSDSKTPFHKECAYQFISWVVGLTLVFYALYIR